MRCTPLLRKDVLGGRGQCTQDSLLKGQDMTGQAPTEVPYNFAKNFEESALSSYNTATDFKDKLGAHSTNRHHKV